MINVIDPCFSQSWERCGVVLAPDFYREGRFIQNHFCSAEPLNKNRWRLWYSISDPEKGYNLCIAEGIPGHPFDRHTAILSEGKPADAPLSIGNLPRGWHPVQGVHLRLDAELHRLYFWAHSRKDGVVRYLAANSVDGRRFHVLDPSKPCLYHPNDRAATMPEGAGLLGLTPGIKQIQHRHADEPEAPASLICNDATNVYRLTDGKWELYSPGLLKVSKDDPRYVAHDNAAGWVRVIDRWTSDDGLVWGDRKRVIVPDKCDPDDMQFYYLSVTHTPQGRVGMLGHYRAEAQTMDIEWCFSQDGIHWVRPFRRGWLERGEKGEADCYGVYAPHSLVHHGGYWWLFYTGVNFAHNHKHSFGQECSQILVAKTKSIWN